MNLVGAEKRIQALYRELVLSDQSAAPEFERLWQVSASREEVAHQSLTLGIIHRSQRFPFRRSFVAVAAAIVVGAVCSLAFWFQSRAQKEPDRNLVSVLPENTASVPNRLVPQQSSSAPGKLNNSTQSTKRFATRRQTAAPRPIIYQAKVISSWQSPTAALMEFPANGVWKSVPQLNQSVKELQLFLPSKVKERNQ